MLVKAGDIGIVQGGSRNRHTNELLKGDHTFMIAAEGDLKANTPTIHLTLGGLQTWEYRHQDAKWICKCPSKELAAAACGFARAWLSAGPERNADYSGARAKAVMHDIGKQGELPFEFDALRRAIKWSRRKDTPFTNRKGLTCAAWTVACYQAAAFSSPGLDAAKLDQAWSSTQEKRVPKAEFRKSFQDVDLKYREFANAGAKTADAMTQILDLLRPADVPADRFLAGLLTPPLVVDARFLHTDGLLRRLMKSEWEVVAAPAF